jgi:ribosome-associated protein
MSIKNPKLDLILASLDDIQALDVKVIDVRDQTAITDYMIIASGRASRHVKAIAEKVMFDMKTNGQACISSSGLQAGDWALIDFGDFILHVMLPDSRLFYNLEGLWDESLKA